MIDQCLFSRQSVLSVLGLSTEKFSAIDAHIKKVEKQSRSDLNRGIHSIDSWKHDASWKKLGEVIFFWWRIANVTGAPYQCLNCLYSQ